MTTEEKINSSCNISARHGKFDDNQHAMRQAIISNTPSGQDPITYWHQVAMDAIHARETEHERIKENMEELTKLRQEHDQYVSTHILEMQRRTVMHKFNELLNRVETGDFSINISVGIYPNNERQG